uniref:Reticulon 4 receptor like 1 n=1 Tax=Varanus komodoensis TaxID=61221 RepID=A0A8D2IU82_VARKO
MGRDQGPGLCDLCRSRSPGAAWLLTTGALPPLPLGCVFLPGPFPLESNACLSATRVSLLTKGGILQSRANATASGGSSKQPGAPAAQEQRVGEAGGGPSGPPHRRWASPGPSAKPPKLSLLSLPAGGLPQLLLALLAVAIRASGGCPVDCVCYPAPMTVSCQSHNFLTIPEGIPEESERVFLQNNQISLLLRGHFSPSLVTLWVYSNNITFIDPNTFAGFVHLEELDLGDNRNLRELSAETFHGLVRLHALHLYKCGLSSLPSGLFQGLHNLQYLYLQDNHIDYLHEDLFADLVNLSHLFLHGNKLWSLHQNTFRGLVNLDRLLLHQNQLQSVHRRAFHDLRRLTLLFLFNNSLSELQGAALAHLGALEYLRLNGNPWNCDCRARSLWDWLRRFRGSSSSVICEFPPRVQGRDLKELPAEDFRGCSSSESLHQINVPRLPSADRAPPRDHPPLHSSTEKGKAGEHSLPPGQRPGYRKPSKNCTKSRNRTTKPSSLGPWKTAEEMPGHEHKTEHGMLPKPKGKCPRTPILPPSGVQQAAGGDAGAAGRCWSKGLAVVTGKGCPHHPERRGILAGWGVDAVKPGTKCLGHLSPSFVKGGSQGAFL